ncbi:MAG TPA: translocation/assembly module TamB domain-containing protein [Burkholderiales bacterium]|nr:translocation/assembly module TamB domain-containing protein [Burkholderiales bacterium]
MKWLLATVALIVALTAAAGAWLLHTEPGLGWALTRLQSATEGRLVAEGTRGTLAGAFGFQSLRYRDGGTRIEIENATVELDLMSIVSGRVGIRSLSADALTVSLAAADSQAKAAAPPVAPVGVRIDRADLGRLVVALGDERHVAEEVRVREAILRPSGAVAASVSFAVPHETYPARVSLKVGGSLERLEVSGQGTIAGVPVQARALLQPLDERPLQALSAEAGPVDLSRFDATWPRTALTVKLSGKATPGHALAGTLSAANAQAGALDQGALPVRSAQARFATRDFAAVTLSELNMALSGGGSAAGSGEVHPGRAAFDVRVSALDLRALYSTLQATQLHGPLRIALDETQQTVHGSLEQPGMLVSADLVRKGTVLEIRSLRALAEGGEATGRGRLVLAEPLRVEADLALARFDPSRFGEYPSGDLSGTVQVSGTWGKPLKLHARWRIDDSRLQGEAFASRGEARFDGERVLGADAQARFGSARLSARGDFGASGDELAWQLQAPRVADFVEGVEASLQASGRLSGTWQAPRGSVTARASGVRLPNGVPLKSVAVKAQGALERHTADVSVLAEDVDLEARLQGGWDRAAAAWSGELQALRNAGRYPLKLHQTAPLRIAAGALELGRLDAALGAGRLLVESASWQENKLASRGEFVGLPAQWLVLAGGLMDRVRTTLLVDGRWDIASTPRLTGTVSLRRRAGEITLLGDSPLEVGLQKAALEAAFKDGEMQGSGQLATRYGSASVKVNVNPVADAEGLGYTPQSTIAAQAKLDFVALRVLTQPLLEEARLDGQLAAELRVTGTLGEPRLGGTLRGEALSFDMPPQGIFLRGGMLRAVLEGETLRITEFAIQGGEGRFVASGTVPLHAAEGGPRLEWRAEKFSLLERPDLRLAVSGTGEMALTNGRLALSGALRADRGYIELEQERLPRLGEDVVIVGEARAPAEPTARLPLALDVQLDLGDALQIRGHGLEGRLTGRLQVTTDKEGDLRVHGRIQTVNATFLAYGHRLQVDPGVVIFDGPLDNPALQLTAWRRNLPVEAGIQISGTAAAPRVQLVSKPPLPEGEQLSWLVLGRAPGQATKADLGLLQAAAGAMLARGDKVPLDRRIAQAFGLDEIGLRGTGELTDRVVAVGKRLSDRLYVSYEQGLGATATALVKLDYALTQRVSVRAETGTTSGIGLFYRFSWD